MENGARRGVLFMKKHCWEIRSSPHEVKVFFRNPTLNSHFKSRFFLVLPTVHPVDGWVSLEERFVKSTVARKKCFLYLMFSFLISQSQLIYYPNELCSLRQFHFSVSPTKQCSQSNQYCQRMQFDWYLGFSESRTCIFVSHKFPQNHSWSLLQRVQPAHRQSMMVHVSVSVACTAQ